ncbi:MAG TPA: DUF1579 domain-containing protein [Gammaproteobacteria bacterium]|nr:DUF1579 domain-containing protein [Gammaproteobacteria bacterium]
MKTLRVMLAVAASAVTVGTMAPAYSTDVHDFDFLVGHWKVHNRVLKGRLVGSHEWMEFDQTLDCRLLMGGMANERDSVFMKPGGAYPGLGLAIYDAKAGRWLNWGIDGRNPSTSIDPPNIGHFENGIGTFYDDEMIGGRPVRVRVMWSHDSPGTARWEQAFSADGGKTWETNWIGDFTRDGK